MMMIRHNRYLDERGFVLVAGVLVGALLVSLGAASLLYSAYDLKGTGHFKREKQTLAAAESGALHALGTMNRKMTRNFGTEIAARWDTDPRFLGSGTQALAGASGFTYQVQVLADEADAENFGTILSRSSSRHGSERSGVQVRVQRRFNFDWGAVYLADFVCGGDDDSADDVAGGGDDDDAAAGDDDSGDDDDDAEVGDDDSGDDDDDAEVGDDDGGDDDDDVVVGDGDGGDDDDDAGVGDDDDDAESDDDDAGESTDVSCGEQRSCEDTFKAPVLHGNVLDIDGHNYRAFAGKSADDGIVVSGIGTGEVDFADILLSAVSVPQEDNIRGVGSDPSIHYVGGPTSADLARISRALIAQKGAMTYGPNNGKSITGNVAMGSLGAPQVARVRCVRRIAGNVNGAGILIVEGDVTLSGNFFWTGWVIVNGAVKLAGNATVQGSLWAWNTDFLVQGHARVHFCTECLQLAVTQVDLNRLPAKVRIVGWDEIPWNEL